MNDAPRKIRVERFMSTDDATLSIVSVVDEKDRVIFTCFGLEDEHRDVKVPGETRIPAGLYRVAARKHGGFFERYRNRFADVGLDAGMPEIMDVPNFTDILIHCGNTDDDTAGCLLVGMGRDMGQMTLQQSADAFRLIYAQVRDALVENRLLIEFYDLDRK